MTEIVTTERQVYRHPKAVAYIADALIDADFEEVPYLYAVSLRRAVGPEIDVCRLVYNYGNWLREGASGPGVTHFNPQDLVGKFVKVVAVDTVYADAYAIDPDTDEEDQSIEWFGVIEYDNRRADGSTPAPANLPSGAQFITAFGVLRLLEKEYVRSSLVDIDGTDVSQLEVKAGLPFNQDPGGHFVQRGNRSAERVPNPDGSYIFSWEPRGRNEWTAFTAVQYLLAHHSPKKTDGDAANTWELDSDEDFLDWYEITEQTDGRNVKQLLDSLIPRHRGVGYWAEFDTTRTDPEDPDTAANKIIIHVFTFNNEDVTLPNTQILKANPDQFSLDFEHAFDIDKAVIGNTTLQRYHRVIARGAKRTTTATCRIGSRGVYNSSVILTPSWTSDDEQEYKDGASGVTGYSGLPDEGEGGKMDRNSAYRTSDRLREVFRRFVVNTQIGALTRWDCQFGHPHDGSVSTKWWLRGDQTDDSDNPNVVNEELDYRGTDYIPGVRILRGLPFYERMDYSGTNLADFVYGERFTDETHPSYIPLLAYARTQTGDGDPNEIEEGEDPHRYELVDRFHHRAALSRRDWSCRVHVVGEQPAVELIADCPHFIASPTAGGTGYALTQDSQLSALHGGISYTDIWVTAMYELNEHIEFSETIEEPPDDAPENVLIIPVPDARHDYVIPHTTVEIRDGLPIETTTGGFAKNDMTRLESIAKTAAQWYSTKRQTLDLRWRQIRATFELGWLITDVGGRYQLTDINTPITAITYDFGAEHGPGQMSAGATHIETSFTSMDFQ
jgi:hypothetical protein